MRVRNLSESDVSGLVVGARPEIERALRRAGVGFVAHPSQVWSAKAGDRVTYTRLVVKGASIDKLSRLLSEFDFIEEMTVAQRGGETKRFGEVLMAGERYAEFEETVLGDGIVTEVSLDAR